MEPRKENRSSPTYVNVEFLARKTTFPSPTSPVLNGLQDQVIKVCEVLFDYDAFGLDELSLRRGEKLELLSTDAKISGDEGEYRPESQKQFCQKVVTQTPFGQNAVMPKRNFFKPT